MQQEVHDSTVPTPLSLRTVKRMGDELIRLCDGIERHGLVDYQFGVWEDEIETCKCSANIHKKWPLRQCKGELVH